ncbi:zinc-dependent alcohol dehydrogenase family protein [Methylophaga thiooxydans]|uniref:Oxidoreductase, zinc-binding dehydrogenase family n=1 Tax=Methylophaga thiooxydans DMS010 TaxID=637616 RepID=C0N9E3_9GAMM|nr:zinc-dependent alcohol dehydrogenase family protein [Methylophaga thiooxydans]EEF78742.1 oxidoreductase, zinc-binding dehydrogenase family [Methylophaga thiooxydans DMS010]
MSKVIKFEQTGEPDVLQLIEEDVAAPAKGEIQIKVAAIGLNRAEAMFRRGQYLEAPELPAKIGYEASGTITALGDGVEGFNVGDAVSTIPNFSMNQYGVYAELTNVPASAVTHYPANLSFEEATSIWMQYLTAYGALIDIAKIQPDDYVLIPAASSSVGLAAIQLCNLVGAVPIAMTRSSDKKQTLLDHGAKHVVVSDEADVIESVNKITHNQGVRVVFDPVAGPMLETLAAVTAQQGIIFQYGALSSEATPFPLFTVLAKGITLRGYTLFEFTSNPQALASARDEIYGWLESAQLKPVVAKTFPLDDIVKAHQFMESNSQLGKIVVTV